MIKAQAAGLCETVAISPFGVYLRDARTADNKSLREVADALGITHVYLGEIERGRRRREEKDAFDFGFEEDAVFRSFDAASTGEDAFLAVVLVAALIAAVQPAWRCLLVDNAEAIDDERRRWLQVALAKLASRFDNVILAGCCAFADVDGWTVVDARELVGTTAAEVAA